jgi:hypothetical protein
LDILIVMPKKIQTDLHVRDLSFVIEEAIRQLPNGESRLAVFDFPLSHACFSEFYGPDISERLSSDYSMPSGNDEIEKQYYEEITTIEKIMVETDVPIGLAAWQSRSKIESFEKMMKGMNRRAYAIQMWDWYAIPWRLRGDTVHMIYSPHDVMGTPIIHSYAADHFFRLLAEKMEKQHKQAEKLNKQLSFWKNFGIIVLVLIGIVLWGIIQGLISKWMA